MSELNLLPVIIHIKVQQEADYPIEVQLTDGAGNAVDITLDTVKLTVKDTFGGTIKIQKVNIPGGHSTPVSGKTRMTFTRADLTTGQRAKTFSWVYEVRRIVAGSSDEVPYIVGNFIVGPVVGS